MFALGGQTFNLCHVVEYTQRIHIESTCLDSKSQLFLNN